MRDIDPHTNLSALWLFILLNIVFRDLHHFGMPGFIETIMTGRINGMAITAELMLISGPVASVPISMVPLSLLLKRRFARPLTFPAAILTSVTILPPAPTDRDEMCRFGLQAIAMLVIVWTAWRWKEVRSGALRGAAA